MTIQSGNDTATTETAQGADSLRSWIDPDFQRIDAGEAEVGTRDVPDGAFTTS